MNQKEMHDEILELVKKYCDEFHNFWVGVYPGMTDEKIDYMVKVIRDALRG